jgi:large conductance mechanosensitive channel
MKKFVQEFKQFALKGNIIDLAIGIMIGTAFNKVVSALVNDILMPPFGLFFGGQNFNEYQWILRPEVIEQGEVIQEAIAINYGNFLQQLIDFILIALSIFIAIKVISRLRKREEEKVDEKPAPPALTKEAEYLKEIRDLLKKSNK